jgi:hypothetical protein
MFGPVAWNLFFLKTDATWRCWYTLLLYLLLRIVASRLFYTSLVDGWTLFSVCGFLYTLLLLFSLTCSSRLYYYWTSIPPTTKSSPNVEKITLFTQCQYDRIRIKLNDTPHLASTHATFLICDRPFCIWILLRITGWLSLART